MNVDDKQAIVPVQLPLDFWLALRVVRDYVFFNGLRDYFKEPPLTFQGSFRDSIDILDCYMDQFYWCMQEREDQK